MSSPEVFTAWDDSLVATVDEAPHVGGFECKTNDTYTGLVVECKYFRTKREAVRHARGIAEAGADTVKLPALSREQFEDAT